MGALGAWVALGTHLVAQTTTHFLSVGYHWEIMVSNPSIAVTREKTWLANPNPAVLPYYAGSLSLYGTITATLVEDEVSIPPDATDIQYYGKPADTISLAGQAIFEAPANVGGEFRDISPPAGMFAFNLISGRPQEYQAVGGTWFVKPNPPPLTDFTAMGIFSISLPVPQAPPGSAYTIEYKTPIPEPEAFAALAGLPLVAWGALRRSRASANR